MKNAKFKVDFIGVGVEKSATYWLAECLKEHPEICFAKDKEVYYFNDVDPHLLQVENLKYQRGIEWYRQQFPECKKGQIKGEWTPTYFFTEETAKRIKQDFPEAKLLLMLRDPVMRAFSQYLHDKRLGVIKDVSFKKALKQNGTYVSKGLYSMHLKNYLKYFDTKDILILIYEQVKKDPESQIKKIYEFLEINDRNFIPPSLHKKINTAGTAKWPLLNYFLVHTEYFLKRAKMESILKLLDRTGIRKAIYNFGVFVNRKPYRTYPELDKKIEKELYALFKNDIQELENILDNNLSVWKSH